MEPTFKIYSGALKTYMRDGKKRLRATASSSIKDMQGDEIEAPAISRMAASAMQKGMTLFLNHSYKVPEDVFGYTESAISVQRVLEDGTPVADMDLDGVLNEANPRAVETYKAIDEQGVRLGVSIGALIKDWEYRDKSKPSAGVIIKDVELLEASIVGIPANPRSWVQHAMKSLFPTEEDVIDPQVEDIAKKLMEETDEPLVLETTSEEDEVVEEIAASIEPDKTDARVSVSVDVDTSRKPTSTETQPSDPEPVDVQESADEAPEEHIAKQLDELGDELQSQALTMLKEMVGKLTERAQQLAAENVTLKAENEELTANLTTAKDIVERIASLPLGRRTSYATEVENFREELSGIYDDEFLKYLEN